MADNTETIENQADKKKRHRSPPYPSASLPEAVGFANTYYQAQRRNTVYLEAAMKSLGYKPDSSGGFRAIAAMIAFGLLEDEGSGKTRKVKLSDLGYKLMVLPDGDPDRIPLYQEAARKPTIYTELLKQWADGLPSDDAISKYLILERNFNPASVSPLLTDFRRTLEFSKLTSAGIISEELEDNGGKPDGRKNTGQDGKRHSTGDGETIMTSLVIPIREGVEAEFRFPANLNKDEFGDMKDYIDTFLKVQERKISRTPAQTNPQAEDLDK